MFAFQKRRMSVSKPNTKQEACLSGIALRRLPHCLKRQAYFELTNKRHRSLVRLKLNQSENLLPAVQPKYSVQQNPACPQTPTTNSLTDTEEHHSPGHLAGRMGQKGKRRRSFGKAPEPPAPRRSAEAGSLPRGNPAPRPRSALRALRAVNRLGRAAPPRPGHSGAPPPDQAGSSAASATPAARSPTQTASASAAWRRRRRIKTGRHRAAPHGALRCRGGCKARPRPSAHPFPNPFTSRRAPEIGRAHV